MSESDASVFDELKAQARGESGEGLRDFAEVAEQDTPTETPEGSQPTDVEGESDESAAPVDEESPDYNALWKRLKEAEKARDRFAGKSGDLKQRNEQLEQRLQLLEARLGGDGAQQPQSQGEAERFVPVRGNDADVEAFARAREGDRFSETWDDEYKRDMYSVAYDVGLNVAAGVGPQLEELKAEVADLRFEKELAGAGLDKSTFDGIVAELPQLQGLSKQDQLATISRLGRSFGSGAVPSPAQGAPTTQRPRIETPMGGGSAMDSRERTLKSLHEAHDSGDEKAIAKVRGSIMDAWKRQQGLL